MDVAGLSLLAGLLLGIVATARRVVSAHEAAHAAVAEGATPPDDRVVVEVGRWWLRRKPTTERRFRQKYELKRTEVWKSRWPFVLIGYTAHETLSDHATWMSLYRAGGAATKEWRPDRAGLVGIGLACGSLLSGAGGLPDLLVMGLGLVAGAVLGSWFAWWQNYQSSLGWIGRHGPARAEGTDARVLAFLEGQNPANFSPPRWMRPAELDRVRRRSQQAPTVGGAAGSRDEGSAPAERQ